MRAALLPPVRRSGTALATYGGTSARCSLPGRAISTNPSTAFPSDVHHLPALFALASKPVHRAASDALDRGQIYLLHDAEPADAAGCSGPGLLERVISICERKPPLLILRTATLHRNTPTLVLGLHSLVSSLLLALSSNQRGLGLSGGAGGQSSGTVSRGPGVPRLSGCLGVVL